MKRVHNKMSFPMLAAMSLLCCLMWGCSSWLGNPSDKDGKGDGPKTPTAEIKLEHPNFLQKLVQSERAQKIREKWIAHLESLTGLVRPKPVPAGNDASTQKASTVVFPTEEKTQYPSKYPQDP